MRDLAGDHDVMVHGIEPVTGNALSAAARWARRLFARDYATSIASAPSRTHPEDRCRMALRIRRQHGPSA